MVDDYGHHPEEIRATLRAAREGFDRRLVVAFQPHRYTRTRDLFDDFLERLRRRRPAAADRDLRGRRGAHRRRLAARCSTRRSSAAAISTSTSGRTREALTTALLETLRPGDLVVVLGAGDITKTAAEVIQRLRIRGSGLQGRVMMGAAQRDESRRGPRLGGELCAALAGRFAARVRFAEPLSRHTSFRIGGPADAWVDVESPGRARRALRARPGGRRTGVHRSAAAPTCWFAIAACAASS